MDDRRRALALVPVSRETAERFAVYADLLRRWQTVKNLVAPSSLPHLWTRHLADSAQLAARVPDAGQWLDMGSGAGFPGLVIAILLRDVPGAGVHLVESNGRKCAFLREVARETGAAAIVHQDRIEDVTPRMQNIDVVTARAVAPLPRLLELARVPLSQGASGVFLKSAAELADSSAFAGRQVTVLPSLTSPEGRIVVIRGAGPSVA